MGSAPFAQLLVVLIACTSTTMVVVSVVLEEYMHVRRYHLMQQCAIGFTGACGRAHTCTSRVAGVLFALKVICGRVLADNTRSYWVFSVLPIPGRYACWAELVQVYVWRTSFLGHLAGILTGLAYINCPPVMPFMNIVWDSIVRHSLSLYDQYDRRPAGDSRIDDNAAADVGTTTAVEQNDNYDVYTGGVSEQEQLRIALLASSAGAIHFDKLDAHTVLETSSDHQD